MKAGSRIRVQRYIMGAWPADTEDFIVEEFRYCLGIFESPAHREAGKFTPLCDLFEAGPDSETRYIPNFGEYTTNQVQAWMDLP